MGSFKKILLDLTELGYTEEEVEGIMEEYLQSYQIRYPMPHIPTEEEIEDTKQDTTWSIKHEGHLNKNNIIFHDNKYQELYQNVKKVNDKLKEHTNE